MGAQFTGASYVELQPGFVYDPRSGKRIVRNFVGEYSTLYTLGTQYQGDGRQISLNPTGGGDYILQVTFGADDTQPTDQPLAVKWELKDNDGEKPIWKAPKVAAAMAYITDLHNRAVIRKYAKMVADGENETVGTDGSTLKLDSDIVLSLAVTAGMPSGSAGTDVLRQVITDMIDGVESFNEAQWVVRKTTIIASNAGDTLKPSYTNINKIYTTTDLFSVAEGVPSTLMFILPAAGVWLKRSPDVSQIAADKWSVEQEFWHGLSYSNLIYEVAT